MKKIFLLLIMTLLTGFLFARTYEIKSFTGSVSFDNGKGTFETVKIGQILDEDYIIKTAKDSSVVIISENEEATIPPMRRGVISEVFAAFSNTPKSIKKNKIEKQQLVTDSNTSKKRISTAASRASKAMEEIPFEETDDRFLYSEDEE